MARVITEVSTAAAALRRGELVAFATETVYGLGGVALWPDTVARIFEVKGRPTFDPLIVHVPDLSAAQKLVTKIPPLAAQLASRFWPGPLTLVMEKATQVPDLVTSGLPSVAIRIPSLWHKSLKDTYNTKAALWGYASQPLIDGEKLIVIAGGEGSHCVALNKDTGEEIWRAGTAKEQGYSPPVIIEQAGGRQLVLCTPESIYAVDPETGKQLWLQEYEGSNGSIIMTPIHHGNHLYVGGWDKKSILIELGADKPTAKTLWRDKDEGAISAVNVQPFLMNGNVYGVDQGGELRCIDLPDGKIRWTTPQPLAARKVPSGTVFLVRSGDTDKFWMFAETGDLIIGQLTPEGFKELSRTHVINATNTAFGRDVVWCAPAFANKRMYVRNDKELICVDLAK